MTKRNPYFSQTSYYDDRIYSLMAAITAVILLLYGVTGCSPVEWVVDRLGSTDDGLIEEAGELYIKHKTGVSLDLTPRSPEQ